MQKIIIAALATVALGKNNMVSQKLAEHTQAFMPGLAQVSGGLDFKIPDLSDATNILSGVTGTADKVFAGKKEYNDALSALSGLTGATVPSNSKEVIEVAKDLYTIYRFVNKAPGFVAMDMLMNFQKYRAVIDIFCAKNKCMGDFKLMGTLFRTIEGMDEEDIELA